MKYLLLLLSLTCHAAKYDTLLTRMNRLAQNPNVEMLSIGKNNDNVDIMALKLSGKSNVNMLVVATHHGNEGSTADVVMSFAERKIKNPDSNYYLVPVLNVPGYNSNRREEKGQDPNRDYPGACKYSPAHKLASTKALAALVRQKDIRASVTLHGYIGLVCYPWGIPAADPKTRDHDYYDALTKKVAQHNGYRYGTSTEMIYPCVGSYEDWAYWERGIWSLLFEVRDTSATDRDRNVLALDEFFASVNSSMMGHTGFDNTQCDSRLKDMDRQDE